MAVIVFLIISCVLTVVATVLVAAYTGIDPVPYILGGAVMVVLWVMYEER